MGIQVSKLSKSESRFTAQVFVQHHGALWPDTAIPRLARVLLGPRCARMGCHCAWEKQLVEADYSSLDCEI